MRRRTAPTVAADPGGKDVTATTGGNVIAYGRAAKPLSVGGHRESPLHVGIRPDASCDMILRSAAYASLNAVTR